MAKMYIKAIKYNLFFSIKIKMALIIRLELSFVKIVTAVFSIHSYENKFLIIAQPILLIYHPILYSSETETQQNKKRSIKVGPSRFNRQTNG